MYLAKKPSLDKKSYVLLLNDEQKIYFEHAMGETANEIASKYTIEFNKNGIILILEEDQQEDEALTMLTQIETILENITKFEIPKVSSFDEDILKLRDPDTGETAGLLLLSM